MWKILIFIFVSLCITAVSMDSFRNSRLYGFPRFFAIESILVLFLLNVEKWFDNPLSPSQIISWVLLIISSFLVIDGYYLLKKYGKPEGKIETSTLLVTRGLYGYISLK